MLLCAQYILPVAQKPIVNGAVLVEGNRIRDIGSAEILKLRHPQEELRDYGAAVLLPGFVDLHTHLEYSAMRGIVHDVPYATWLRTLNEKEGAMAASDWDESALYGGLEALSSGITTIADITNTGASFKAALKLGLRGVIYREVGAMDKKRVEFAIRNARADIDRWRSQSLNDRIIVGIAPYALYTCHPSVLQRVSEIAQAEQLPVAIHMAGSREEFQFIRYGSSAFAAYNADARRGYVELPPWLPTGVSPVRYALNWGAFEPERILAVHCVHMDDEDISMLKERDVSIAVCPRCNAQLGMGVAPLAEYHNLGMRVGLGTDSPAATDSTDMIREMRTGMLLQRAMGPQSFLTTEEMLEMATIGGARALHLDHEIGSLEIGKKADIIAVGLSQLPQTSPDDVAAAIVNKGSGRDVIMTMVDGDILYEQDKWHLNVEIARNIAHIIGIREKLRA